LNWVDLLKVLKQSLLELSESDVVFTDMLNYLLNLKTVLEYYIVGYFETVT